VRRWEISLNVGSLGQMLQCKGIEEGVAILSALLPVVAERKKEMKSDGGKEAKDERAKKNERV